jgi:UDP-N-acetylglucosamine transferase subunit ALG13
MLEAVKAIIDIVKKNKSIFVTVGNGKFDPLIKKIDDLVMVGKIKQKVVIQIGHGKYKPKHCQWFTFESPLTKHYNNADLIISHGGPGCVFEILRMKKKLIAIPNRDRTDPNHQVEYLQAMEKETTALIYCDNVDEMELAIEKSQIHKFENYVQPVCTMGEVVKEFLEG